MIDHGLCRPPRGVKLVKRFAPKHKGRSKWIDDDGKPGLAFVGVDDRIEDGTAAIIWVVDCKCPGGDCPRVHAMAYAAGHYDTTEVHTRRKAPSDLMKIVKAAAKRFDKRPLYRASLEAQAELKASKRPRRKASKR